MSNYVVFDLEWNQGDAPFVREDGKTLTFEIVEIGAVKLNENREKIGEFSRLIKPQVHTHMHRITGKLIHLSMEDLAKGDKFQDVARDFLEFCGEDVKFCTWGPLDLTELQRNLDFYGMPLLSDRPIAFYDVQKLYSLAYDDGKSRKALEAAVDEIRIPKDIPFHRALADAEYTAKIFRTFGEKTLTKISFDTYVTPKTKKQEIRIVFDTYAKYISREFLNKEDILKNVDIMSTKCYICKKNIRRKVKWFTPNGKHYYSAAFCDKHGFMKAKVRIKKAENGNLFVVKTCRFISNEDVEEMKKKQHKIKKRQRS
ncbi:MAG: exonuclease domain-containing protein [Butyrivibrio sp.]|uniref:3'-5' exonuclease n=1 Tax=Butyrivibrio sp. TaxID=28121 RepID=UPI001B7644A9|nr:3'-5' exonuclease [Butyrivibrio sp.]MBP3280472.1 exonuclease domain-containing protein [Butyrivibrio sp.]MBP3783732.1 exonuclease domain-containing protein [Butyrivibrio sp.]